MPQLLSANGRRSGGRHIDSAVRAAASGANANKRGSAGLVFANIELRPTSLRHFLASSALIAAARADGVIPESALIDAEDVGYSTQCWMIARIINLPCYTACCALYNRRFLALLPRLLVPYIPLAKACSSPGDPCLAAKVARGCSFEPVPRRPHRCGSGAQDRRAAHPSHTYRRDGLPPVQPEHGATRSKLVLHDALSGQVRPTRFRFDGRTVSGARLVWPSSTHRR